MVSLHESILTDFSVGKCENMCPKDEMIMREREGLLHQFEMKGVNSYGKPVADPEKTVKQFQRSAAGTQPFKIKDIRPPRVLKKTIIYLMENVLTKTDVPWKIVYDFIFDRLRAIRQDLVIQNSKGPECVYCLEVAVRFYVYSFYRLNGEAISVFDPHINGSHLQECLKQLLRLYDEEENYTYSNRSEIISYYALYNFQSTEAITYLINLPIKVRSEGSLKIILNAMLNWQLNNYVRTIRLISLLSPLEMWLFVFELQRIRRLTLKIMSVAYNSRNCAFPLNSLSSIIGFNNDYETASLCESYGFEVCDKQVKFLCKNFTEEKHQSLPSMPLRESWDQTKLASVILRSESR